MTTGPAPLYVDTFELCRWLMERFRTSSEALPRHICQSGLGLLQAVTLALKGRRREEHMEMADERLIALRTQLRLAAACGYLEEAQMLFALERADRIGRQLGGWMKSQEQGSRRL
jgi:hypothetical protein